MKTERKEELEANELEDWLTTLLNDLKPYATMIVAGAVLAGVGIFLFVFGSSKRQENRALAWTDLFSIQVEANSTFDTEKKSEYVDKLVELANREKGTPVGAWALQYAGDISLALGSDNLWNDREKATTQFKAAVDNYATALSSANHDVLRQRALMGMAQANEALSDFTAAEGNYEQIIKDWPEDAVAKSATDRLAFLKKADTKEFYDWFLAQEPPKPQLPATIPDIPGVIPSTSDLAPPTSSSSTESSSTESTGGGAFELSDPQSIDTPAVPDAAAADAPSTPISEALESATEPAGAE